MEYTPALLSGLPAEEHSVADLIAKYLLQLTSPGRQSRSGRRGSVDSCDEKDHSTDSSLHSGLEQEESLLSQDVAQQLERCLTEAKASSLHCQVVLMPHGMTTRVSQDVMAAAVDEPCGLRGASIKVYVDGKDGLQCIGNIFPDHSVTSTFELSVVFKAEKNDGWPSLKLFSDSSKVLKLRPEYRLVKRKLYSSATPVVHDFISG